MKQDAAAIRLRLRTLADSRIAAHSTRFFKSGPGEYGEGDRFLGIRVPVLRQLAREYRDVRVLTAFALLRSGFHEERLLALLLLVSLFARGDDDSRANIYAKYLQAISQHVNNWDLVDTSAPAIVGAYLEPREREPLYELARSCSLWERRVAIMATFWFIRRGDFDDALSIATLLLQDEEDLIHKATGWMLREIGNRDRTAADHFLRTHYSRIPRTMLRYAIEKLPASERKAFLTGQAP